MSEFVAVHLDAHRNDPLEIVDFGAQMIDDEQLSYRTLLDAPSWNYRGVDIVEGRNVDVVLADPYRWSELPSESLDLFMSGQAFEHIEHFWVTIFEVVRVLKPGGITAIIAPSSGYEHRYPVDCWRFYSDGMAALARYAQCEVVDVFADWGNGDWGDAILVLRKPEWPDDERSRFDHRAGLQRLVLSELPITAARIGDEWQYQPQTGDRAVSALADVRAGDLTQRLTARRDRRVADEMAHAELAEQERVEHLASLENRLAAISAQNAELLAERGPLLEQAAAAASPGAALYGQARSKVADLVGERGRSLYKRLRGRA